MSNVYSVIVIFGLFILSGISLAEDNWSSFQSSYSGDDITGDIKTEKMGQSDKDYTFSDFGKQDPFVPPKITLADDETQGSEGTMLQKYSISDLKLVGLLKSHQGEKKAIVMTPDDEGIIIKKGDLIGKSGGKVIDFEDKGIRVRESYLNSNGNKEFKDFTLQIPESNDVKTAENPDTPASPSNSTTHEKDTHE
jgi:Tfp pilus assembly protein PilP